MPAGDISDFTMMIFYTTSIILACLELTQRLYKLPFFSSCILCIYTFNINQFSTHKLYVIYVCRLYNKYVHMEIVNRENRIHRIFILYCGIVRLQVLCVPHFVTKSSTFIKTLILYTHGSFQVQSSCLPLYLFQTIIDLMSKLMEQIYTPPPSFKLRVNN